MNLNVEKKICLLRLECKYKHIAYYDIAYYTVILDFDVNIIIETICYN